MSTALGRVPLFCCGGHSSVGLSLRLPQASLISSVPNSQGEWERLFLPLLLLFFLQRWDKLRISSMPSKCSSPRMSYPKQKLVSYHFVNKILECISGGNSNSLPWWGRGSFFFFCFIASISLAYAFPYSKAGVAIPIYTCVINCLG